MAKHLFDSISRTLHNRSSNSPDVNNQLPTRNTVKTSTTTSADSGAKLITTTNPGGRNGIVGGGYESYELANDGEEDEGGPKRESSGSKAGGVVVVEDCAKLDFKNSLGRNHHLDVDPKSEILFDLMKSKYDSKKWREDRRLRHSATYTDGDGSSSSSSSSLERMEAPDGGWGWVVVFAAFLINMVSDGVTFSFGIFYVEFYKHFQKDFQSKSPTAWIGSLLASMPLLSGPVASILTDRYGCRLVTIAGSLMATLGFILASFADSLPVVYLTFGVLTGFGLSLCYVAAVVIVAYYFERRRSLATGLSVCGGGIGTFLFAPFTQFLMDYYGNWREPTRILAGAFFSLSICGLLMKDLEWTKKQRSKSIIPSGEIEPDEGSSGLKSERLFSSALCIPTFVQDQANEISVTSNSHKNGSNFKTSKFLDSISKKDSPAFRSDSNNGNESMFSNIKITNDSISNQIIDENKLPDGTVNLVNFKEAEMEENSASPATKIRKANKSESFRSNRSVPIHRPDIVDLHRNSLTYRGAVLSLKRYRLRPASSCPDIISEAVSEEKSAHEWKELVANTCKWVKGVCNWKNLTNSRFILFLISNFLLYMWYDCPYVYLKDAADQNGYPEINSSKLISIVGLFNMFGNIFLGYIGDKKWTDSILVYGICMVICGITSMCLPILMAWNYVSLAFGCALFGLTIAANYSLTSVILVKIVSLDGFSNAYGILLLVQGVGNLIGPPLGGVIYDVSGAISWAFVASGIGILLSSIFILAPKLMCYSSSQNNVEITDDEVENALQNQN